MKYLFLVREVEFQAHHTPKWNMIGNPQKILSFVTCHVLQSGVVYQLTSNAFLGGQTQSASSDKRSWRIGFLVYSKLFRFGGRKTQRCWRAGLLDMASGEGWVFLCFELSSRQGQMCLERQRLDTRPGLVKIFEGGCPKCFKIFEKIPFPLPKEI